MVYKNFSELVESVKKSVTVRRAVVVSAEDEHALEAVLQAKNDNIVQPVLVGNVESIIDILKKLGENPSDFKIYDAKDFDDAAAIGVQLIREGKGDFLMKGKLDTSQMLRAVVNEDHGLGTGSIMSHVALNEVPSYHKLLMTTDGGMIVYPTFEEKIAIVNNAVKLLRDIGYDMPKVAVLANSEVVNPKIKDSYEAGELKKLYEEGVIKDCILEGPVALDIAVVKAHADVKNFKSPVAGDADIILSPNLFTSNTLGKSITELAGGKMAGLIVGAQVPIIITSRGSSAEEKYNSIVVAAASCKS